MQASVAERFDLKQKVALVTGASVGIGARIAECLGDAGATVAIVDVDREKAVHTAERIRATGAKAKAFACDVSNLAELRRTVDAVTAELGAVEILVNNAGIFPMKSALEITEDDWDRVLDINLKGAFFLAQYVARIMIERKMGGSIVNIASVDGLHPTGRLVHYDASKAGLIMMTRSLAFELGTHRIRVNAVAPGAIQTPGAEVALASMGGPGAAAAVSAQFAASIPLGRMGVPEDIARAVLFLVSRAADYVTGSTLVVDGGMLLT